MCACLFESVVSYGFVLLLRLRTRCVEYLVGWEFEGCSWPEEKGWKSSHGFERIAPAIYSIGGCRSLGREKQIVGCQGFLRSSCAPVVRHSETLPLVVQLDQ